LKKSCTSQKRAEMAKKRAEKGHTKRAEKATKKS
jgi:hypothetical protein